jgi:hypothetical protein
MIGTSGRALLQGVAVAFAAKGNGLDRTPTGRRRVTLQAAEVAT